MKNKLTPVKSIRKYCVWCMNGSYEEITNCLDTDCAFFFWRFGKRPTNKTGLAPLKVIRKKCIDCSENLEDIRNCKEDDCPIYPYRMGKSPTHEINSELKIGS